MVAIKQIEADPYTKLVDLSKKNGFITTEQVFNFVEKESYPITEVDRVCDELLDLGIIIKDDEDNICNNNSQEEHLKKLYVSNRDRVDYQKIFDEVIIIDSSTKSYIKELKKIPPSFRGEQKELICQIIEGNQYARERLVQIYLKVVVNLALKFSKKFHFPIKDAIQDGNIGLINAVDKLSIDNMHSFSNSVQLRIHTTIFREDISICQSLYVPVYLKQKLYRIINAIDSHPLFDLNFNTQSQQNSLAGFISEELQVNIDQIFLLLSLLRPSVSLDEEFNSLYSPKVKENQIKVLNKKELKCIIIDILSTLKIRERVVIELRTGFKDGKIKSYKDVGKILKEKEEQIVQYESIALRILENPLKTINLESFQPKERYLLEQAFGIDWLGSKTLEEIGSILGVTRERIRQIESSTLRKLKHPNRSKKLKVFYE